MKIFAMFDRKAGFFMQPFPETSTIAALRGFEIAVNDAKSIFCRFPDDFSLMELADFNQQTGQIVPHTAPLDLGTARSVLKNPPTQDTLPGLAKNSSTNEVRSVQ